MDSINLFRKKILASGRKLEIFVSGNSMEPMIRDGDTIVVAFVPNYVVGDVVVFVYDFNVLVHRILKMENGSIYCKGDNSFRLEQISFDEIMGKVIKVNGVEINALPRKLLHLSFSIGKIFEKNKSVELTKSKLKYKKYKKLITHLFEDNISKEENEDEC